MSFGDIPVAAGELADSRLRSMGSVVPFARLLLPFVVAAAVVVAGGVSVIEGVVTAGGATGGGG